MMTADEYQREALKTEHTPEIVPGDDGKMISRLLHAAFGACTEAGELQDGLKKHLMYGRDFDPTNVIEECGDLLWYISLALDACGYKLSDCMERNIAKLRSRYGEKFSAAREANRDLASERAVLEAPQNTQSPHARVRCTLCEHEGTRESPTGECVACGWSAEVQR